MPWHHEVASLHSELAQNYSFLKPFLPPFDAEREKKTHLITIFTYILVIGCRPARIAELPRSKFDPELFPHSAYVEIFCDIRDKSAVFNILQQNVMHFDVGNGKRGRKWRKREEIERE